MCPWNLLDHRGNTNWWNLKVTQIGGFRRKHKTGESQRKHKTVEGHYLRKVCFYQSTSALESILHSVGWHYGLSEKIDYNVVHTFLILSNKDNVTWEIVLLSMMVYYMCILSSPWCVIDWGSLQSKYFSQNSSSCEWTWSLHAKCFQCPHLMLISPCCTSFSIVYPSISETMGFPRWSRVEHKELISKLSYGIYLSIWRYKRIVYNIKECEISCTLLCTPKKSIKIILWGWLRCKNVN